MDRIAKRLQRTRGISRADKIDPNYRRLAYVRYADDFLIGLTGPREDAVKLKQELQTFLKTELNLTLHPEKTRITHASQPAHFLGFLVRKYRQGVLKNGKLYGVGMMRIETDTRKIVRRLAEKGFCDLASNPKPLFK